MLPALSPSFLSLPHLLSVFTAENSPLSVLREQAFWRSLRLGSHQETRRAKQTKYSLYLHCTKRKNFPLQINDFRIFFAVLLPFAIHSAGITRTDEESQTSISNLFLEWKHCLEKLRQLGGGGGGVTTLTYSDSDSHSITTCSVDAGLHHPHCKWPALTVSPQFPLASGGFVSPLILWGLTTNTHSEHLSPVSVEKVTLMCSKGKQI